MGELSKFVVAIVLLGTAWSLAAQDQSQLIADAKAKIVEKLKDPDSAQFRNVVYVPSQQGTGWTVCGEVNAKNGYGGFSGFTPFFVVGDSAILRDTENARMFDTIASRSCGN